MSGKSDRRNLNASKKERTFVKEEDNNKQGVYGNHSS